MAGAGGADALRQVVRVVHRRADREPAGRRRARVRRGRAGHPRPQRVAGTVRAVRPRGRRRLRHGGVGRRAALEQRRGGRLRLELPRRDGPAGGARRAAAPEGGGHLPDGRELPRRMDLLRRRLRAVVQPLVDELPGLGHRRPRAHAPEGARGDARRARGGGDRLGDGRAACAPRGPPGLPEGGPVLARVAGAPVLRRLLEADRPDRQGRPPQGAPAAGGRLVRQLRPRRPRRARGPPGRAGQAQDPFAAGHRAVGPRGLPVACGPPPRAGASSGPPRWAA